MRRYLTYLEGNCRFITGKEANDEKIFDLFEKEIIDL